MTQTTMHGFSIGDRVRINERYLDAVDSDHPDNATTRDIFIGCTGTVIGFSAGYIEVECDTLPTGPDDHPLCIHYEIDFLSSPMPVENRTALEDVISGLVAS
jgi:hypothetical protein